MRRRKFITSASSASVFGLAGCNALSGSTDSDMTVPSSETPTSTETPTPTAIATPSPKVQKTLEEVHTELTAAFEVIHSMEFYRNGTLLAVPEEFEQYEPQTALSHVENAREALRTLENHVEKESELQYRVTVLKSVALVADEGATLYDNLRKTFRECWQYEYRFEHAKYEKGVEDLNDAQAFLAELPKHRKEVADGLTSIENAPVASKVEGFDFEKWSNIVASIEKHTPALSATFKGFQTYTEAVIYDNQGLDALENHDGKTAYESFRQAVKTVADSKASLATAKYRNAEFYRERVDAFFCRCSGMKQAYQYHIDAAKALANGNEQEAEELRQKGLNRIGEAIDNCPRDG